MPLQATSGAASYDAFGGGVPVVPNYIEECFSCFLYTGNGSTQTITNGIDLSTKGGLVWYKDRTTAYEHQLVDTVRGAGYNLETPNTSAQASRPTALTAFNTTGFTLGSNAAANGSGDNFVSWTFRKQPKFFDVITWTGTNSPSSRLISHSLGSQPGHIMMKRTDATGNWSNWHINGSVYREFTPGINSTASLNSSVTATDVATSTSIDVWYTQQTSGIGDVNGATYVAYIFAHNAGGFGLTGTDNVISCGTFTTGSGGKISAPVNLGYEAQWLLAKNVNSAENWVLYDIMRGMNNTGYAALNPNNSGAEYTGTSAISPTATGFDTPNASGPFASSATYIYIAIRRGPMKVPTVGTTVYNGITRTGTTGAVTVTGVGFTPDLGIGFGRSEGVGTAWYDRLRGKELALRSAITNAEYSSAPGGEGTMTTTMDGMIVERTYGILNSTSTPYINWFFKRAPGFFDEVCYTGTGSARTVAHNLGVVPEMMIVKSRGTNDWAVYNSTSGATQAMYLNSTTAAFTLSTFWNDTAPTSTVFTVGTRSQTNEGAINFVAYLFATCAGVSKVGSYTGNGSTQTIDCGFTGGARFVLVKATSTTGNWIVADSARGIVAGNEPALYLNSTAAEVTGLDWIDADNSGFVVNETATIAANTNGVSYIFLAIA